ncbi:MAG TPA: RNA polymerase sigma factor, partial [Spirochaetia bacterium]|nr:RNA polymerase sigma factor [Spirochaetia bacterium]
MGSEKSIEEHVAELYRTESRRVLATLIRLLGDFDLAEEALQEAFSAALEQWPREGIPRNPRAWLVSAGRFKGIDTVRRRGRHQALLATVAQESREAYIDPEQLADETIQDDQLRLIFTCCHPALPQDGRIALALREVCGLTTEEIARAYLVTTATMTRRIARAKEKIRKDRIPYEVPSRQDLAGRLAAVLQVVYLVYNEGFVTTAGRALSRRDLTEDAVYLGRLIVDLIPEPEAIGLLGLMLLHESRRPARADERGDVIPLEDQDRSLWNRELIEEAVGLVHRALVSGRFGSYTLQAAIAGVHAVAPSVEATDWAQIVRLYDMLLEAGPSPVVELNRAIAVAMRDGPTAGLALIDALLGRGELVDYHPAHAVRADLNRRLGRMEEAVASYRRALTIARQEPERRFLERRLAEISGQSLEAVPFAWPRTTTG